VLSGGAKRGAIGLREPNIISVAEGKKEIKPAKKAPSGRQNRLLSSVTD